MRVVVNGDEREVHDAAPLSGVVDAAVPDRRGVAVAVNGEVVRRADWDRHQLKDGDRVEVLAAQQGG